MGPKYVSHYVAPRGRVDGVHPCRGSRGLRASDLGVFSRVPWVLSSRGAARRPESSRYLHQKLPVVCPCAAPPRPQNQKKRADPSGTAPHDAEASVMVTKRGGKQKLNSPTSEQSDENSVFEGRRAAKGLPLFVKQ